MENVYLHFSLTPIKWIYIQAFTIRHSLSFRLLHMESTATSTSIMRSFGLFFQISKLISLLCSLFACPQTGGQTNRLKV